MNVTGLIDAVASHKTVSNISISVSIRSSSSGAGGGDGSGGSSISKASEECSIAIVKARKKQQAICRRGPHDLWLKRATIRLLNYFRRNYVAVAYNATIIIILDLSNLKKINEAFIGSNDKVNDTEEISSKTVNKVVATLKGHCNKIVGLGWSPDLSGYLVGSSDNHCKSLCCRMRNPLDSDLIITGSIDFTLHLWRIST
ncbi:hypothetical protein HZH68_006148 [Vespula germanica]|uniref:Uncharacterized protein n=1 Tax=Vespula germanica TaxID=30212 RepID=A0A834NCR7_VESGE|nr:hypothetical protein HZH68_006148 [Vespula germanica]